MSTTAQTIGRGAGKVVHHGNTSAAIPMLGIAVAVLMLAKTRGAAIDLPKTLVGLFAAAIFLSLLGSWSPVMAALLAAMILVEVLISYGQTALGGLGSAKTTTAKAAPITTGSVGSDVGAAAVGFGAAYGLDKGLTAAGQSGLLGSLFGKVKKIFTNPGADAAEAATAAEDAAPLAALA